MRHEVAHPRDEFSFVAIDQQIAGLDRQHDAVDLLCLECCIVRLEAAEWHADEIVMLPALRNRCMLEEPVGQRTDRRDGELLALHFLDVVVGRVGSDNDAEIVGPSREGGDRLRRNALRRKAHAGTAAKTNVDAVGGKRLLHPRVAAKRTDLDIDIVLRKDPGLLADIERREGPGDRHRFADPDRVGCARCAAHRA